MLSFFTRRVVLICLFSCAFALRTSNKTQSEQNSTAIDVAPGIATARGGNNDTIEVAEPVPPPMPSGPPGFVDSLFTYGGPEVGKPALTSFGGCFKGRHAVTVRNSGDKQVDSVPVLMRMMGYQGARIELDELDIGEGSERRHCEAEGANRPDGTGKWGLHDGPEYFSLVEESGTTGDELDFAFFALHTAGEQEALEAKKGVEKRGWRLVASASHPGGGIIPGPQVSHLIQNPQTLDCVVTFPFTKTSAGWWKTLLAHSKKFCGLPGDAQVHMGLADAIELTTNSTEWKFKVRPNLSFCKKVVSVGHSQGAAQAELFAACINQHPEPDAESYKSMRWTKLEPKQLPYL